MKMDSAAANAEAAEHAPSESSREPNKIGNGFVPVVKTPLRAQRFMHGAFARRKPGRKGGLSKVTTRHTPPPSTHPCEASGTLAAAAMPAVHNSGVL